MYVTHKWESDTFENIFTQKLFLSQITKRITYVRHTHMRKWHIWKYIHSQFFISNNKMYHTCTSHHSRETNTLENNFFTFVSQPLLRCEKYRLWTHFNYKQWSDYKNKTYEFKVKVWFSRKISVLDTWHLKDAVPHKKLAQTPEFEVV